MQDVPSADATDQMLMDQICLTTRTVEYAAHAQPGLHLHMTIVLCKAPGLRAAAWDCGGTYFGTRQDDLPSALECDRVRDNTTGSLYTYSYTNDLLENVGLKFPPGIGIQVGGTSGYNSMVMVNHYPSLANLTDGWTGRSSVTITLADRQQEDAAAAAAADGQVTMKAGTLDLMTFGEVPPLSVASVSNSFLWHESIPITPFAYLTHSHAYAILDEVWRESPDGRRTPVLSQDPSTQLYYPIKKPVTITQGDRLVLSCTYNNTDNEILVVK